MKKLLSVFVALCFLSATAVVSFAQDTTKKADTKKKGKKKKQDTTKDGK